MHIVYILGKDLIVANRLLRLRYRDDIDYGLLEPELVVLVITARPSSAVKENLALGEETTPLLAEEQNELLDDLT